MDCEEAESKERRFRNPRTGGAVLDIRSEDPRDMETIRGAAASMALGMVVYEVFVDMLALDLTKV